MKKILILILGITYVGMLYAETEIKQQYENLKGYIHNKSSSSADFSEYKNTFKNKTGSLGSEQKLNIEKSELNSEYDKLKGAFQNSDKYYETKNYTENYSTNVNDMSGDLKNYVTDKTPVKDYLKDKGDNSIGEKIKEVEKIDYSNSWKETTNSKKIKDKYSEEKISSELSGYKNPYTAKYGNNKNINITKYTNNDKNYKVLYKTRDELSEKKNNKIYNDSKNKYEKNRKIDVEGIYNSMQKFFYTTPKNEQGKNLAIDLNVRMQGFRDVDNEFSNLPNYEYGDKMDNIINKTNTIDTFKPQLIGEETRKSIIQTIKNLGIANLTEEKKQLPENLAITPSDKNNASEFKKIY